LTYSDGLTDVDIAEMTDFHRQHGRLVSMLAVRRPIRYGRLMIDEHNMVKEFVEKPVHSNEFINGGLFIVEPEVLSFIREDSDSWEYDILPRVVKQHQLMAWQHDEFWQCMDYPHEVAELDALWKQGSAPWKKWNE
jgi:glucose-1-phosphate cytidylyltransferase